MESQQDIVDLTINNDDDCLFPTELSEMVNSLLKMDGMEGNKETAKQNNEDDTLSIYGSEDGEIVTDKEEEKEKESKKIIFKRIWPNFGKTQEKQCSNPLHSMFTHAAIKLSRANGKVQFEIQNENAKRILCKHIWKIGNDSQAWHSFGRWCFHNRPRF